MIVSNSNFSLDLVWGKADFQRQISDKREKPDKQPAKVTLEKPTWTRNSPTPNKPIIPQPTLRKDPLIKSIFTIPNSAPPENTQPIVNSFNSATGGLSIRGTNDSVKSQPNTSPTSANDELDTNGSQSGFLVPSQYTSTLIHLGGLSTTTFVKPQTVTYEAFQLEAVVCFITRSKLYRQTIKSGELNERRQLVKDFINVFIRYEHDA